MPIEIKELAIKINVSEADKKETSSSSKEQFNKEALINECLEQVAQMIKSKKER